MAVIRLPVITKPPSLRVDGSALIKFETRELTNDEVGALRDHTNMEGWLIFSPNPLQDSDIPRDPAKTDMKTPSSRLRSVLFIWYRQLGSPGEFQHFYETKMNDEIEKIKERLD